MRYANDPQRRSWLTVPQDSDFPIQNLPFGIFSTENEVVSAGTRIGDVVIDLAALHRLGYFRDLEFELPDDVFLQNTLNAFIELGKPVTRALRDRLAQLFDLQESALRDNEADRKEVLHAVEEVQMLMPVFVQDYTDFYSSREHATNVGIMFRGKENALMPNWLHLPVGYHGRASSIVVSGEDIVRPKGQMLPPDAEQPVFGPSRLMDFELEMAFITTASNHLGDRIPIDEAEDYIFGLVQFNDWSARDIQAWEYVPLGPFLGKNFASTISPWIVTLDALEPFRVENPTQDPQPLPYLQHKGRGSFDIHLQVGIQPEGEKETVVANSNFKYMYWTMAQQLAHHTVNGCPVNSGDIMGSGTISGPTKDSFGSMLELTWRGQHPIKLSDGTERKFINDNDTVIMRAYCQNEDVRIGFGECTGKVLPAKE